MDLIVAFCFQAETPLWLNENETKLLLGYEYTEPLLGIKCFKADFKCKLSLFIRHIKAE